MRGRECGVGTDRKRSSWALPAAPAGRGLRAACGCAGATQWGAIGGDEIGAENDWRCWLRSEGGSERGLLHGEMRDALSARAVDELIVAEDGA